MKFLLVISLIVIIGALTFLPSLALGPAFAHFGWARDDWDRLAGATMAGHLLECGAQVTGGYFAPKPYMKQVAYGFCPSTQET